MKPAATAPAGVPNVALLFRGVNVGPAKRVAMADLRALVEELGAKAVATLLNSGNVVCRASGSAAAFAARVERALPERVGFPARVVGASAADLATVIAEFPWPSENLDPSRVLVGFAPRATDLAKLRPLASEDRDPERLVVGARAAYLFCPSGVAESKLAVEAARRAGDAFTARNWTTTLKIARLLGVAAAGGA